MVLRLCSVILAALLFSACSSDGGGGGGADISGDAATSSGADTATSSTQEDTTPNSMDATADAGGCVEDRDCGRGTVCGGGECVRNDCTQSISCPVNQTCLIETGATQGTCTAVECLGFANDPPELQCGPDQTCTSDLLCADSGGPCASPEDCASVKQVCNPTTMRCEVPPDSCVDDWQCVSPQTCGASGACGF